MKQKGMVGMERYQAIEEHFSCDICGLPLSWGQEFHGNCPRCGASVHERHLTRETKIKLGLGGE